MHRALRALIPALLFGAVAPAGHAEVTGRVVSGSGEALPGATVEAFAPEPPQARAERLVAGRSRPALASAHSAADGSFRLDLRGASEVQAWAEGFAPLSQAVAEGERLRLELRRAPTRRGRVTAGGQPVAGATVAWHSEQQPGALTAEWLARSGSDGSYRVPDPVVWAESVSVFHPGHAPSQSGGSRGAETDLVLEPGVSIEGRVVGPGGKPLAGARVWVSGWPLGTSGPDGAFAIRHAPRGWTRLLARGSGLVGEARVAAGPLLVAALPASSLSGLVREAKSQRPIPGAAVLVWPEGGHEPASVWTDAAGRYAARDLMPGRYLVGASKVGHEPSGERFLRVDLRQTPPVEQDLELVRERVIEGRVVDEEKRPIEGALVAWGFTGFPNIYLDLSALGFDQPSARTAADGSFVVRLPEAREDAALQPLLVVLARGHAAGRWEPPLPDLVPPEPPLVVLQDGVPLEGTVTDREGLPLAGVAIAASEEGGLSGSQVWAPAWVSAGKGDRWAGDEGWVKSDALGRFSLRVHPRPHTLALRRAGLAPRVLRGQDPAQGRLVVVLEPGLVLRGRVEGSDGSGVGRVSISLRPRSSPLPRQATSDAEGRFEIPDLQAGSHELAVSSSEQAFSETRQVELPSEDVLIRIPPRGKLRGHVVDARTHRPLPQFQVMAQLAPPQPGVPARRESVSDAGGGFVLSGVPAGNVTLTVSAEGYLERTFEELEVVAAEEPPDLEVALEPGVTLRGRVTAREGEPLAEANVVAESEAGGRRFARTDEAGDYEVAGLRPGKLRLQCSHPGFLTQRRTVEAGIARADVVLERGLALRGVVVDRVGGGVAEATVEASSSLAGAEDQRASTDEAGNFALTGLVPGRYTVEARQGESSARLPDVDVEKAGKLRLVLEKAQTATLVGRVVGLRPGDEPLMVEVSVEGEDGRSGEAMADTAGTFRVADAPAGRVLVSARAAWLSGEFRSSRQQELVLSPDSQTETVLEFDGTATVSGTVRRKGAPVPSAQVRFSRVGSGESAAGRADAAGHYEVGGLVDGPHTVAVSATGVSFVTEYPVNGSGGFDIDVPSANVSGVVTDAARGTPLAGASVSLWRAEAGGTPVFSASTDERGRFQTGALRPGPYRALAAKAGYGQQVEDVELSDTGTAEVALALPASEGLTLTVADARDGRALVATVVVRDAARRIVANSHSGLGDDGSLTIPLAAGDYLLSTSATGYGTATLPVTAPGQGLRVLLTPGGTLVIDAAPDRRGTVRLLGSDGEPYVRCWCNGIAEIELTGRRTTVANITPGVYTVELQDPEGERTVVGSTTILEGQTSSLAIP